MRDLMLVLGAGLLWGAGAVFMIVLMGWQTLTWVVPFEAPWHYRGVPAATVLDGPRLVMPPPPPPPVD
jgi:hypothetical protein